MVTILSKINRHTQQIVLGKLDGDMQQKETGSLPPYTK